MGIGNNTINTTFVATDKASPTINNLRKNVAALGGPKFGPLGNLASGLSMMGGPALLGAVAIGGLTAALGDSIKNAIDEQKNIALMGASLKANIPNWNGNTDAIEGVISANEKLAFSDDDQRAAMGLLVARTHDVGKAMDLMRLAMDLARLKNIDLASAVTAVGKASSGNYVALQKMGIAIAKGSTATQALAQIQKAAAGQATAYGNTTEGAMKSAEIAMQDASETIGAAFLPVVKGLATFIRDDLAPAIVFTVTQLGNLGSAFNDLHRFIDPGIAAAQDFEAALRGQAKELGLDGDALVAFVEEQKKKAEADRQAALDADASIAFSDADRKARLEQADAVIKQQAAQYGMNAEWVRQAEISQGIIAGTDDVTVAINTQADAAAASIKAFQAKQAAQAVGMQMDARWAQTATRTSAAVKDSTLADSIAMANGILEEGNKIRASNKAIEASYLSLGSSFKATLKQMKQDAKTGLADIRFTMKHDGSETKRILQRDMAEAVRLRNIALATGNTRALAEIDAYIADVRAKMANLNLTTTISTNFSTSGGHHVPGSGMASGGAVSAGTSYMVGEKGPETFVPATNGTIVPNGGSSQGGDVYLDGFKVGKWLDKYLGKQLQIAARTST